MLLLSLQCLLGFPVCLHLPHLEGTSGSSDLRDVELTYSFDFYSKNSVLKVYYMEYENSELGVHFFTSFLLLTLYSIYKKNRFNDSYY